MPNPVLRWAGLAQKAGRRWGIPTAVLLGLVQVESGGILGRVSPTGAGGLTQFEPGTAASYHVLMDNPESQLEGAAHYLHDLGYAENPHLALASYNAGPGNPAAAGDYPEKVLAAAANYGSVPTTSTTPTASPATPTASSTTNPLNPAGRGSGTALHALIFVALLLAAITLTGLGSTHALGLRKTSQ